MTTPEQLNWVFVPVAAGLGALHALEPGHGKTLMAVYLAGNRGTIGNAVGMGIVTTITHTFIVFVLAILTATAASFLPMHEIQYGLGITSAGLLVALGLWLVLQRWRELDRWRSPRKTTNPNDHHNDHHHHDHSHDHGHDHSHDHFHAHPGMKFGEVLTMGISAGLVPCPGAMAVFLLGVTTGQYVLGLITVTVFSIGLAATLVGLGVAVVLARKYFIPHSEGDYRWAKYTPLATAAIVTVLGGVLLYRAIVSGSSHDHADLPIGPPWLALQGAYRSSPDLFSGCR